MCQCSLQHNDPVNLAVETMNISLLISLRRLRQHRGDVSGDIPIATANTPEQRRIQKLEAGMSGVK